MMAHKDNLKNGLEYDVIFARRWYCYLQNNSKLIKFAKRSINKRARAKAKKDLKNLVV